MRRNIEELLKDIGVAVPPDGVSIGRVDCAVDILAPGFMLDPDNFIVHQRTNPQTCSESVDCRVYGSSRKTSFTVGKMPNRTMILYDKRAEVIKKRKVEMWEIIELDKARREAEAEAEKARKDRLKAEKEAREAEEARREAEAEADEAKEEAEEARKETEKAYSENLFLRSMANTDITDTVSFVHHIGIASETIENYVKNFSLRIRKGQSYSEDTILETLNNISSQARKILTTSKFVTKANFSLKGSNVEADLCEYLGEYIDNICTGVIKNEDDENMIFEFRNPDDVEFQTKFHPLEISIILDNLISNAKRAKARKILIEVIEVDDKNLTVVFSDDGKGVAAKSVDRIFEIGFTTTSGSGLGLGQTKKLLEKRKGEIELLKVSQLSGAAFKVRFSK